MLEMAGLCISKLISNLLAELLPLVERMPAVGEHVGGPEHVGVYGRAISRLGDEWDDTVLNSIVLFD